MKCSFCKWHRNRRRSDKILIENLIFQEPIFWQNGFPVEISAIVQDKIRPVVPADLPALKKVIDENALFPSDLLDDMIAPYFGQQKATDFWITFEEQEPVAITYFAPEQMTEGTYNLYLIAVHPDFQGKGIGEALMRHVENFLSARGHRILLVETSGLPEFERTRHFYDKLGYQREARIREFYAAGEDKIVFWKKLN